MTASPALLRLLQRRSTEVECRIAGASMGRAIADGASVMVRLDGAAGARPGDVVAVLLGGDALSIHRLVHRGASPAARGYVITRGDGNLFCDAPQRAADCVGTVTAVRATRQAAWGPVPSATEPRRIRRLVAEAFAGLLRAGLEVHPRLAFAMKNALVWAATPFASRYYRHSSRQRSTSAIASPQPQP